METKIVACLLYMSGLSYRPMKYHTGLIPASHVAVFYWIHALEGIVFNIPKKERRVIAMDETKLKVNGRQVFLCVGCNRL
ncbi:MAG: hypothetical protein JRN68_06025 [Nitrososphaerota archaeon]|nr:hypothetical protein [Nitrososphaerota archaeon]